MSGITYQTVGMTNEEALTSDDSLTRCLARLVASEVPGHLSGWLNAELQRGENEATILFALMKFSVQTHASITGQIVNPVGVRKFAKVYEEYVRDLYVDHAARSARRFGEERACRKCGCTDTRACVTDAGPCHWVEDDLCSACGAKGAAA